MTRPKNLLFGTTYTKKPCENCGAGVVVPKRFKGIIMCKMCFWRFNQRIIDDEIMRENQGNPVIENPKPCPTVVKVTVTSLYTASGLSCSKLS